jgi:hypothetical protein
MSLTEREIIEMGYNELKFDDLETLKEKMRFQVIPFGNKGQKQELKEYFKKQADVRIEKLLTGKVIT